MNNNFVAIALRNIQIGNNVMIGTNVEMIDNDGHNLDPAKRRTSIVNSMDILIGDNVWIGSNVKILKGVKIGQNSVVSNGAVVTKSFAKDVVIGGIPAKVIKSIYD